MWRYAGPVRPAVQAFKYGGRGDCLAPFGRALARAPRLTWLWSDGDEWWVVPVPARRASARRRGYDQARLLAEALAGAAGLGLASHALVRRRQGGAQAGARLEDRRQAMRAALRARPEPVAGRAVLLVDDVLSTGATADAAARALRLAGARRVRVVALAT